jgi:hypothetical protein
MATCSVFEVETGIFSCGSVALINFKGEDYGSVGKERRAM